MSSRHAHDHDIDAALADDDLDPRNPYASATRWRHEESSQFHKHAGLSLQPRAAEAKTGTHDLAKFLNSSRVAPDLSPTSRPNSSSAKDSTNKHTPIMVDGRAAEAAGEPHLDVDPAQAEPQDGKTIVCGPLLNYRRMEGNHWVGSVLIVTRGGGKTQEFVPTLALRRAGEARHIHANGANPAADEGLNGFAGATEIRGHCLYSDYRNTFWRFDLRCEMEASEIMWEYTVPDMRYTSKKKPHKNSFFVPAITESMRSMFLGLYRLKCPEMVRLIAFLSQSCSILAMDSRWEPTRQLGVGLPFGTTCCDDTPMFPFTS